MNDFYGKTPFRAFFFFHMGKGTIKADISQSPVAPSGEAKVLDASLSRVLWKAIVFVKAIARVLNHRCI